MNQDKNLKDSLDAWKVDLELPPRFQAGVWQQIAAQESARTDSLWHRINQWIAIELARPSRAAIALTASLALSAGIAFLQAQDSNARNLRQLEARYIESINPLAQEGHTI